MQILINFLLAIYVLVALLMLLVILMQRPKSEGLGAAFGGGVTENIFGAQTTNVLVKFTVPAGWPGSSSPSPSLCRSCMRIRPAGTRDSGRNYSSSKAPRYHRRRQQRQNHLDRPRLPPVLELFPREASHQWRRRRLRPLLHQNRGPNSNLLSRELAAELTLHDGGGWRYCT